MRFRRYTRLILGVLIVLAIVAMASYAQPAADASKPPRIGIALSGGGARGLAHIGVLKVLEELRVRENRP